MIYLCYSCFLVFISHLSLPEDVKSCVLEFLDTAPSDKNAWQRRSFLSLLRGRGFVLFFSSFFMVGYQSMVTTGFVRRVCVYLAGRERFEWVQEFIIKTLFFLSILIRSVSCIFAFFSVLHGERTLASSPPPQPKSIRKVGILFFILICSCVIWNSRVYVKADKSLWTDNIWKEYRYRVRVLVINKAYIPMLAIL
jgi:hypothetical protein